MALIHLFMSKVAPTGWSRGIYIVEMLDRLKSIVVGIGVFYAIAYTVAFIASNFGAGMDPVQFAGGLIYRMLFEPFTRLAKVAAGGLVGP